MITIDLVILIPLIVSIIAVLGMFMEKVNWFISMMGIVIAFGISYYIAPFSELIFTPLKNSLWYGYSWGLFEYMILIYVTLMIAKSIQALYNLYMTNGKKIWG